MTTTLWLTAAVLTAYKLNQDGFWVEDSPRLLDLAGFVILALIAMALAVALDLVSGPQVFAQLPSLTLTVDTAAR